MGDLYSLGKGKFYREDGDLTLDATQVMLS